MILLMMMTIIPENDINETMMILTWYSVDHYYSTGDGRETRIVILILILNDDDD